MADAMAFGLRHPSGIVPEGLKMRPKTLHSIRTFAWLWLAAIIGGLSAVLLASVYMIVAEVPAMLWGM